MQYRTFMEKFGASSKEQIQLQMRSSIRIATTTIESNKRKSIEPAGEEVAKRVKVEEPQVKEEPEELNMDESFESIDKPVVDKPAGVVSSSNESSKKKANTEFSCDYCSGDVSFPIFNLLVVHIKNEHANKYIQFRIKKTEQVPYRCQKCNFCFPDERSFARHTNKKICEKNQKLFEEYTQSLEADDDDDEDEDDLSE